MLSNERISLRLLILITMKSEIDCNVYAFQCGRIGDIGLDTNVR